MLSGTPQRGSRNQSWLALRAPLWHTAQEEVPAGSRYVNLAVLKDTIGQRATLVVTRQTHVAEPPCPPTVAFQRISRPAAPFSSAAKSKAMRVFGIFPLILVLGGGDICATLLVGRLGCHGGFALRAMSAHSLPARPGDSPGGVYLSIIFQTTSSDKEGPRETATTFSGGEDPTQQRCIRIRQQVFMNHDTCVSVICCFGCTLRQVLLQQVIRAPSFCSKQTANTYSAVS